MSVAIATRVFRSEVLVGLMWYFANHPAATKPEATAALDLPRQVVAANVRILIEAGVLTVDVEPRGTRPGRYTTDTQRVRELADALAAYSCGISQG